MYQNVWATFVRKIVTNKIKKLPTLVTFLQNKLVRLDVILSTHGGYGGEHKDTHFSVISADTLATLTTSSKTLILTTAFPPSTASARNGSTDG